MAIQHVESRERLLPRLVGALGAGWHGDAQVVAGREEAKSPWETYRDCLALCEEHAAVGFTHLLVMQDDALPVPRFRERTLEHVTERPADLLCLYTPMFPSYMGRVAHAAYGRGQRFAQLPTGMFTPLVATLWPVMDALDVLAWWENEYRGRRPRRCDDALVAQWLRARRRFAQAVVPCLADHDEAVPSTLGLGRYRRSAAVLAD